MIVFTTIWKGIKSGADWFWNKATLKTKLVIVGLLAVLIVAGYIVYLQSRVENLEQDVRDEQIGRRLDAVNGITNQINNSLEQSNVLQQNSNLADLERGNISNRDSSTFNGTDAFRKFCKRYPNDSKCQQR